MSYNIFERVQKCWMVFPTFLMKFTMFDGLHRLLTCYITFVQLSNFRRFECAMSFSFCKSNKCVVVHEMAAKKCNKKWEDGEIEKLIDLYEENSCL